MVAANSVMSSYVSYFAPRRLRPLVEDNELPPGKKISLTIIIYQHMLSGVYQGNTFSNEIESHFKIVHIARKGSSSPHTFILPVQQAWKQVLPHKYLD